MKPMGHLSSLSHNSANNLIKLSLINSTVPPYLRLSQTAIRLLRSTRMWQPLPRAAPAKMESHADPLQRPGADKEHNIA